MSELCKSYSTVVIIHDIYLYVDMFNMFHCRQAEAPAFRSRPQGQQPALHPPWSPSSPAATKTRFIRRAQIAI
jgi:hypothetical protein